MFFLSLFLSVSLLEKRQLHRVIARDVTGPRLITSRVFSAFFFSSFFPADASLGTRDCVETTAGDVKLHKLTRSPRIRRRSFPLAKRSPLLVFVTRGVSRIVSQSRCWNHTRENLEFIRDSIGNYTTRGTLRELRYELSIESSARLKKGYWQDTQDPVSLQFDTGGKL